MLHQSNNIKPVGLYFRTVKLKLLLHYMQNVTINEYHVTCKINVVILVIDQINARDLI